MSLLVNQSDGATASSVPGGRAIAVLLAAPCNVLGDACVQRTVAALHDIHEPLLTSRSCLRVAVPFRHLVKIPDVGLSGCPAVARHQLCEPAVSTALDRTRILAGPGHPVVFWRHLATAADQLAAAIGAAFNVAAARVQVADVRAAVVTVSHRPTPSSLSSTRL